MRESFAIFVRCVGYFSGGERLGRTAHGIPYQSISFVRLILLGSIRPKGQRVFSYLYQSIGRASTFFLIEFMVSDLGG